MKVSIVIPMFNASKTINACLESLRRQTFSDFEVIIVDDASSDGSCAVVEGIISSDGFWQDRLKLLQQSENGGSGNARRRGMLSAKGDYIIHVDADDTVSTDYLEKLVLKAEETNADVVVCKLAYVYSDGAATVREDHFGVGARDYLCQVMRGESYGSLCNKLIRRGLIEKYDIYPYEGIRMFDDFSVVYRVLFFAHEIAYEPSALYFYNKESGNTQTMKPNSKNLAGVVALNAEMKKFAEKEDVQGELGICFLNHSAALTASSIKHAGGDRSLLSRYGVADLSFRELLLVLKSKQISTPSKIYVAAYKFHMQSLVNTLLRLKN